MYSINDWFFLALGLGFALYTALHAYQRGESDAVIAAEKRRNRTAKRVQKLKVKLARLCTEHARAYRQLHNIGLETISQAKGLCEIFRRTAQRHSKFSFEPEIPNFLLPPELESPEPPPPPLPNKNFQEPKHK